MEAAARAAELLADAAKDGGHVALAGGSTPRPAYEQAGRLESDWSRVEVWFGDERCVPPWDDRSNFRLARESLFDGLARTPGAVHRISGELGPDEAARAYDEELQGIRFRLVLLGIGADGHTASLFPQDPALREEARRAVPVLDRDPPRVTLTRPALAESDLVVFLAIGEDKAGAVAAAFRGPPGEAVPASLVRSAEGRTVAVVDAAAAREFHAAL